MVAEMPARCERCWYPFGPRRVLRGWDNLHEPPCFVFHCRFCWQKTHVMTDLE